jgi:excisionase family DNA binding protein
MMVRNGSLLTVQQVGKRLGVSPNTVRRWIGDGNLPALKFGESRAASVRIDPADLDQLIANARKHPGDAAHD